MEALKSFGNYYEYHNNKPTGLLKETIILIFCLIIFTIFFSQDIFYHFNFNDKSYLGESILIALAPSIFCEIFIYILSLTYFFRKENIQNKVWNKNKKNEAIKAIQITGITFLSIFAILCIVFTKLL